MGSTFSTAGVTSITETGCSVPVAPIKAALSFEAHFGDPESPLRDLYQTCFYQWKWSGRVYWYLRTAYTCSEIQKNWIWICISLLISSSLFIHGFWSCRWSYGSFAPSFLTQSCWDQCCVRVLNARTIMFCFWICISRFVEFVSRCGMVCRFSTLFYLFIILMKIFLYFCIFMFFNMYSFVKSHGVKIFCTFIN